MKGSKCKSVLFEMPIKSKRHGDIPRFHNLKAETVNEADVPLSLGQETLHGLSVPLAVNPYDFQERQDSGMHVMYRVHADTSLQKRSGLYKNERARQKLSAMLRKMGKIQTGSDMHVIIPDQKRKEPGGVHKDIHESNASSR